MQRNRMFMRGSSELRTAALQSGARGKRAEKNVETNRRQLAAGRVRMCLLFVGVLAGGIYLYSINKTAVAGYAIRAAEKKVAALAEENQRLRIHEAELRSLYRIEAATQELNMLPIEAVSYVKETGPVALK